MNDNEFQKSVAGAPLGMVPTYISMADQHLYDAQKKYEDMVVQEGEARDVFADEVLEYERAYGEFIKTNKSSGSITILKEESRAANFELYSKMTRAESKLKKIQAGKEMWLERINVCKMFLKIKFSDLGNKI